MKKLISALLCLALLVSCAPVLAFAASEGVTVTNMDELTAAIDAAEPGDTVVLAAGEYAPEGGVLTIDKAVNLRGSIPAGGAGYTEFNGAIVYDLAGDARGYRVDVQRIRFNAVEGQSSALTLASGRGWVLAVENCAFNDWLYGVNVLPECRSCKLDVYDSDFNGFCAVSVAAVAGNGVQRLMPGSTGLYEYRKYDSRGNDAYYYDYDAAGGEQATYDAADYIPEGDITAESPYQARIGDRFYTSLDAALKAAKNGDTVYALRGVEQSEAVTVSVKSGVTLDVAEGAYIFESVENSGRVINRGTVRGGISGEGETLTLVTCETQPEALTVKVTDTSGREYRPDKSTNGYLLPEGQYTFTVSGDGYYTKAQSVVVESEKAQILSVRADQRLSFSDVSSADWFYEEVYNVYSSGLMDGVSDTAFDPNGAVTRAMAVTILYRLAGEPDMPEANWGYPYADVDAGSWYATAVYWARMNGIVNGTSEETFSPDTAVTREQLAAMLYRYAVFSKADTSIKGGLDSFSDAASISGWARDAAAWCVGAGIITGSGQNQFDPLSGATRAQLAAMLVRFSELKA